MIDYAALKAEIAKPEYNEMTDAQIAALLNVKQSAVVRPIRARDIKKLWSRWAVLAECDVTARDNTAQKILRVLCRATYDNLIYDVFDDIDPNDATQVADVEKYLGALEGAGILTAEQRAATLALGSVAVTFPESIGTSNLNSDEIAAARNS